MKKALSLLLSILFLCTAFVSGVSAVGTATPTSASVLVNGTAVPFEAYSINGNNYFKLRDLAKVLSGTKKQFEVGWDTREQAISLTSGQAYTTTGGELTSSGAKGTLSAAPASAQVYLDGKPVALTAYNINGYHYFKLRDVGRTMDFGVTWDGSTNSITINTSIQYSENECLTVHFLDVGQGDSIFIVLPDGKTMLIDAGERQYGDTIVRYIKSQGYQKIDYLVATHPHADHIGGMTNVVESLSIGSVYMPNATTTTQTYIDLLTAIKKEGLNVNMAKAGTSIIDTSDLSALIIAPNSDSYHELNNYSAVIKLTYEHNSFLFMGDAEEASEKELSGNLKSDVLKIGHHGSDSSTSQELLNRSLPTYAVISVGADNIYEHPSQTTINKLNHAGVKIYRTDQDGTIVFQSDGTNISVNKAPAAPSGSPDARAHIVISNVDKVGEIVTIKNSGASETDLTGWVLVSVTGNQRYTFPSYRLKSGEQLTVASGGASGDLIWTGGTIWNNSSSDPAQLFDAQGTLIFTYSDEGR